jgi:hypothetical protein
MKHPSFWAMVRACVGDLPAKLMLNQPDGMMRGYPTQSSPKFRRIVMAYTIHSTIRQLLADERAKAVIEKHILGATTHPQLPEALHMTLGEVATYPESGLTPEKLRALVEDLAKL